MGCGSSKQAAQTSVLDELAAKNVELQAKMDAMAQQQQESAAAALAAPAVEQTSVIDEALVSHLARVLQMPKYEKNKNPRRTHIQVMRQHIQRTLHFLVRALARV